MSLFVIGLFLLIFPLLFLSITTDSFVMPKQIALAVTVGLFFIFFVLKTITQGKLTFRGTPFDLPVLIFVVIAFLSAILSSNRFDALIGFTPFLFTTFLYFGLINIVKSKKHLTFIISCLVLGSVLASTLSIFSFFKIYLLPFDYTHAPYFTTFGSLLDQAIYAVLVLPLAGQFIYKKFISARQEKKIISPFEKAEAGNLPKQNIGTLTFFGISSLVILAGLILSIYLLLTTQKPLILPLEIGLQVSFAAISQDTGQVLKSLLLGSGIGTFLSDFTRFKAATYNAYPDLWSFTFFRSSTYVLELIATTGLLGFGAFVFLIYRVFKQRLLFLPLLLAIIAAFVLPFSFTSTLLFFILLAIFAITRILSRNKERVSEIEFYFVALKRKFLGQEQAETDNQKKHGRFLSIIVSLLLLAVIGVPLYFTTTFFISDLTFQQALVAASKNQGTQTYELEIKAIKMFPYRDVYYRAFSQTNLALANLLVQQQKDVEKNEEAQQKILTLIQQSINSARTATTVAPLTSFNWNSLSSIYRSLIGFGQNADQFTLLTAKQAISLDPNNPQQYIEYGGIYYQLGNYDEAIRQFQFAINLKNDYANAYYNLGHALELKGNLNEALQAYTAVKKLVANNKANSEKIDSDIAALQDKIGKQQTADPSSTATSTTEQQPLNVNQPSTQLPERKPPVEIPAPTVSPIPTKATTPTPAASPTP
jgi:tetratricopeptide (TPR) repeat protein